MSVTQNLTLTSKDWVEVPETDCTLTIEGSDNTFLFWTDGAAPTEGDRGHYLNETKVVQIGATEKLWVHAQDGSATIVYTVAV